jgi:membrane protein implicated in regulation of membrane protease activity
MQLAILLVLILIAVILAPWLLTVIAALIAAYGLWLIIAAALSLTLVVVVLLVYSFKNVFFPKRDVSSRIEQQIAEVNIQNRAKEAAKRALNKQETMIRQAELERVSKKRMVACKKCEASIERHSMYCPKCGKIPV